MKTLLPFIVLLATTTSTIAQYKNDSKQSINHAFDAMLVSIEQNYAYQDKKPIDWACIKSTYKNKLIQVDSKAETLLFFEHLLHEFSDNHFTLNANVQDSYRLNSPVFVKKNDQGFHIEDFWQSQIVNESPLVIGAKLLAINGISPVQIIKDFPVQCLDKNLDYNQQWIINKALAGQYSKPRKIEISVDGKNKTVNLDQLTLKQSEALVHTNTKNNFAIITINNSLGQTELIHSFDQALKNLMTTEGLIIDLRNTISGGGTYIARAIMGRLISKDSPYQKHQFQEQQNGGPQVTRSWIEYVTPRFPTYEKPVIVLVNHWTGSMGEGMAIGLQGMNRAQVIGTEMAGLLGAVNGFPIEGLSYGFQMPIEKLFHIDGTPRELFQPDSYVYPGADHPDNVLQQGLNKLKEMASKTNGN